MYRSHYCTSVRSKARASERCLLRQIPDSESEIICTLSLLLIPCVLIDPGPFLTLLLTRICVRGLERDALPDGSNFKCGTGFGVTASSTPSESEPYSEMRVSPLVSLPLHSPCQSFKKLNPAPVRLTGTTESLKRKVQWRVK